MDPGSYREDQGAFARCGEGSGEAGNIRIPTDIWRSLLHPNSLEAMKSVQLPQPRLPQEVRAMSDALIRQGHIRPITPDMLGVGLLPGAPIFVIPKSAQKCSFIVNCKVGSKHDPMPQPKMHLATMWTVRQKFNG